MLRSGWWKALRFSLRMLLCIGRDQANLLKAIDVKWQHSLAYMVATGDRKHAPLLTNRQEIET